MSAKPGGSEVQRVMHISHTAFAPERVRHVREKAKSNISNVARARLERSHSVASGRRRHASR